MIFIKLSCTQTECLNQEAQQNNTDTEELVEYIKELHEQLKSKNDQIEVIKEKIRCKEIWSKKEEKTLIQKVNYYNF